MKNRKENGKTHGKLCIYTKPPHNVSVSVSSVLLNNTSDEALTLLEAAHTNTLLTNPYYGKKPTENTKIIQK